jgi:hypothetical protein
MDPIKAVPTLLHQFFTSDAERARAMQLQAIRQQHAQDDAARQSGGVTRVLAITSFTVIDGANPRGRTIRAGDEFDMPTVDLDGYTGKVMPAALYHGQP